MLTAVVKPRSSSPQCRLKTGEQVILSDWLGQETNRPSLHRACPGAVTRMAGDKNDGYAMPHRDQTILQVKSTQAGHLQISDETRCVVQRRGFEKFLCRAE